jgi:hypothetical protein
MSDSVATAWAVLFFAYFVKGFYQGWHGTD